MKIFMKVVLNICVSIILILLSVQIISTKPYMMLHENRHVSHNYIEWDYEYASEQIMRYLNGSEDDLVFPSFEGGDDVLMTERGLSHMEDVRTLYDNGRIIIACAVVFAAISGLYLWDRKEFWLTLKRVWIFPAAFVTVVGVMMAIDFNWAFTLFHQILFTNDLWLLSALDPLIIMLPYEFFLITGVSIIVFIIIFHAFVLWIASKKSTI